MMIDAFKTLLRPLKYAFKNRYIEYCISEKIRRHQVAFADFNFGVLKKDLLSFVSSMELENSSFAYRYSSSCSVATLYSSVYACLTLGLLGEITGYSEETKKNWARYFDSFQREQDGLFYDPAVQNDFYDQSDWWGRRHLASLIVTAYMLLGQRPKYPFSFLKQHTPNSLLIWLDAIDWEDPDRENNDLDNHVMNIGVLLQYQRDAWGDGDAADSLEILKHTIKRKILPETGLWGKFDLDNAEQKARMVRFAYHLLPIFFYDGDFDFDAKTIVHHTLATQNRWGGFGVSCNTSACEDIDSICLLTSFYNFVDDALRGQIRNALERAFFWVLLNKTFDGGFVFKYKQKFQYGCKEMTGGGEEGALFPSWFRSLSLAYMANVLPFSQDFHVFRAPGCYAFPHQALNRRDR